MLIRRLTLRHFRNYELLDQEFSPELNVLLGKNAQGKSNLLEAIYLLATTKSFRGSKDADLIAWDQQAASAEAEVLRRQTHDVDLQLLLSRKEKRALVVNSSAAPRSADFIGQLKVVGFGAPDLEIVRGEPARRRRFLDLEISQISPSYCHGLGTYRRLVEHRTGLLRQGRDRSRRPMIEETLAVITDQLVAAGARTVDRRRQFIRRLQDHAGPMHERLSGGAERLMIAYEPSFKIAAAETDLEESFRVALREVREEEFRRQVCLLGPHRDDVRFFVNGRDVKTYGSQGQQRTAALALKLGEIGLIRDLCGEAPVCMLDDVFSELDETRRACVLAATAEQCQTFVSTTELAMLPSGARRGATCWTVSGGTLRPGFDLPA